MIVLLKAAVRSCFHGVSGQDLPAIFRISRKPEKMGCPIKKEGTKFFIKEELKVSDIIAPMGGKVFNVKVKVGDAVNEGDEVIVLEAMKMELPIVAEASGTVKEVKCSVGDTVEAEGVLIVLE